MQPNTETTSTAADLEINMIVRARSAAPTRADLEDDPLEDEGTHATGATGAADMVSRTEDGPMTPEQIEAETRIEAAALALLEAGRDLDRAYSDPGDDERQPLAGSWALVALARAAAARAHDADDLRLVMRPHPATLRTVEAAPTGRSIATTAGDLGVYVVGGRGIDPRRPYVSVPVDPSALALGSDGLRGKARDCEFENAADLWDGRFADLVAGAALARHDLPLTLGTE